MTNDKTAVIHSLEKKLEAGGVLNASDLAVATDPEASQEQDAQPAARPTVPVDQLFKAATEDVPEASVDDEFRKAMLAMDVSEAEKGAFKAAIIANSNLELPFEFYGGALRVRVRGKRSEHTQAVVSRIFAENNANKLSTQHEYRTRLRALLMAMQIASVGCVDYPEPAGVLGDTVDNDGHVTVPDWVHRADAFLRMNEALFTTLWEAVNTFERKYWRMQEASRDANFWSPAASS